MQQSNVYLQRYAHPEEYLTKEPVPNNLGMEIVIPSYKEKKILSALKSLDDCDLPRKNIEVIVVVNQPEDCSLEVDAINQQTVEQFKHFKKKKSNPKISYQIIYVKSLPKKHAGVGMARKIGMDEAVRRLLRGGNNQGVILNFDADCTCSKNYLQIIEMAFTENNINGASIYFEHLLYDTINKELIEAIIQYELHLRYFVHALRYAGFPYAFHTVGSSMAVRSDVYQQQGGMNRRKAGEDFYFLNKIIPLGNFIEIGDATVMPSIRASDRVPFGTGRAMSDWSNQPDQNYLSYSPDTFRDMKKVFTNVDQCYKLPFSELIQHYRTFPVSFRDFVSEDEFHHEISTCGSKSASYDTFRQKIFTWMNGLKVLRYVHHCRDNYYPNIPVYNAGSQAVKEFFKYYKSLKSAKELLLFFRNQDRNNPVRSDRKGRIHQVSAPQ